MSENGETAAATQVPAAEEEKKHDVDYADDEAKGSVSANLRSTISNRKDSPCRMTTKWCA